MPKHQTLTIDEIEVIEPLLRKKVLFWKEKCGVDNHMTDHYAQLYYLRAIDYNHCGTHGGIEFLTPKEIGIPANKNTINFATAYIREWLCDLLRRHKNGKITTRRFVNHLGNPLFHAQNHFEYLGVPVNLNPALVRDIAQLIAECGDYFTLQALKATGVAVPDDIQIDPPNIAPGTYVGIVQDTHMRVIRIWKIWPEMKGRPMGGHFFPTDVNLDIDELAQEFWEGQAPHHNGVLLAIINNDDDFDTQTAEALPDEIWQEILKRQPQIK